MNTHELAPLLKQSFPDLKESAILTSQEATAAFGQNTLGPPTTIAASITIDKQNQIPRILKLANQHSFKVCPISTGNNWGYGSINPLEDEPLLLLNLGELKGIYPINQRLGFIRLEPGVTQQDLADYLEKNQWDFMTPVTGAGPSCSIVSNALERGYGITPFTDHFWAASSFKYYIAAPAMNYVEISSPLLALDKSKQATESGSAVDASHKMGLGPNFDGLLTQSNLAIVSEMTLRLAPIPDQFRSFYIQCKKQEQFTQASDFIQKTMKKYSGEIGSINLMDKHRVISMVAKNPNGAANHVVMSDSQIEQALKDYDLPEWTIVGSIYTTKETFRSIKRYIKKHAQFADRVLFSDSFLIKAGSAITSALPGSMLVNQRKQIEAMKKGIEIMLGKPNDVALPLAYWRNPNVSEHHTAPLSPAKDQCGLLWYAPLLEMSQEKMTEFVSFVRETTPAFGIEPLITFTNLSFSCVDSTVPIVFNLNDEKARQDALRCLNTLFDEGLKRGFVPYRLPVHQQLSKLDPYHPHWQLVSLTKQCWDPNNVINPNRYCPRPL